MGILHILIYFGAGMIYKKNLTLYFTKYGIGIQFPKENVKFILI